MTILNSQQAASNMIAYAKMIAIHQKHYGLVNGLQPFHVLNDKAQQKFLEIRQTYLEFQQQGTKTSWHVLRKAASLYYYSIQLEYQNYQQPYWPITYASIKIYLPFEWKEREVEAAADAMYAWRSSSEENKDEALEVEIIQERIESLPRRPGAKPGNQYHRKDIAGHSMSIYLTAEDIKQVQFILEHRGRTVSAQEENRLVRAILRLGIQEEYEKISNAEIE